MGVAEIEDIINPPRRYPRTYMGVFKFEWMPAFETRAGSIDDEIKEIRL